MEPRLNKWISCLRCTVIDSSKYAICFHRYNVSNSYVKILARFPRIELKFTSKLRLSIFFDECLMSAQLKVNNKTTSIVSLVCLVIYVVQMLVLLCYVVNSIIPLFWHARFCMEFLLESYCPDTQLGAKKSHWPLSESANYVTTVATGLRCQRISIPYFVTNLLKIWWRKKLNYSVSTWGCYE